VAEEIDCGYLADYEKGNEPNSLICVECFMTVSFNDSFVFRCSLFRWLEGSNIVLEVT
jgi:hypothetical protein